MSTDGVSHNRVDVVRDEGVKQAGYRSAGCASEIGDRATTKSMLDNIKDTCVGRVLSGMGTYLSKVMGYRIETQAESIGDSTDSARETRCSLSELLAGCVAGKKQEDKSENFLITRVRAFFTQASVWISGLMAFAADESSRGSVNRGSAVRDFRDFFGNGLT